VEPHPGAGMAAPATRMDVSPAQAEPARTCLR
jgi:hypothetical protein